ncbi:MAG: hypothetical protein FLDDKLPJ_01081 [Phycisphaerae bacterium]|nr:hypothetical protein [Phycisphaerae bacterium]
MSQSLHKPGKRVLMITVGAYPPSRGPGSLRALGFSRHLPEFGWQPVVMTQRESDLGPLADASLRDRIPSHVELHEMRNWEYVWRSRLRRALGRSTRNASASVRSPEPAGAAESEATTGETGAKSFLMKLFGPEVYPLSFLPVLKTAKRLAAGCRAIFSTSPPFQNHLIARRVQRATGLPWVADFRDPYACDVWHLRGAPPGHKAAMRRERAVLKTADAVVVVTQAMKDLYLTADPTLPPDRLHVISNGYDEDLALLSERIGASLTPDPKAPLTLLHAGRFYADDALDGLCRAVRGLLASGRCASSDIRLEFLGALTPSQSDLLNQCDLLGLAPPPRRVPQREAFERMCRADVLLVEAGANIAHYAVRAKLFEYMVARRPVLALAEEGETARIVKTSGVGVCISPFHPTEIEAFIAERLTEKRTGRRPAFADRLSTEFDRRFLTRRLAEVLDAGGGARST